MKLERTCSPGFGWALYLTAGRLSISLTVLEGRFALSIVWA